MLGLLCLTAFLAIVFRFQCIVDMILDKFVDNSNRLKPDRVSVQEFESTQAYSISQSFHNIIERLDEEFPFFSWHWQKSICRFSKKKFSGSVQELDQSSALEWCVT